MLSYVLKKALIPMLFLATLLASCTYTTTKSYQPVLTTSDAAISAAIGQLVTCEHISLDGKKNTTNGNETTALHITILNGQNIPQDEDAEKAMAKQIATIVKNNLKDPNQYKTYKVSFEKQTRTADGATSTSITISLEKEEL